MIDRKLLDELIDLHDPHWTDADGLFNVYLIHRRAELKGKTMGYIQNTSTTIGRLLLYISDLERKKL